MNCTRRAQNLHEDNGNISLKDVFNKPAGGFPHHGWESEFSKKRVGICVSESACKVLLELNKMALEFIMP